ncbi:penicillin-binding transpeptidase domain-containing protein [Chitinophagaceae bacterium MMS25-I14]
MHFNRLFSYLAPLLLLAVASCDNPRIKEKDEWGKHFADHGIKNGCFILRDNNHESVLYYNKERCIQRFSPASTFKIFNSLVALETGIAPDEQMVIKWDGVQRSPEWDKDMTMREAFKVSCVPYYQEIARRIGPATMQHYLDTVKYGNMHMGGAIDMFWLNDTLQISADEQMGLMKKLYFNELPFSERAQRIVRSMMLQEDTLGYKLYYKTGWSQLPGKQVMWITGFAEKIVHVTEAKESMNKTDQRAYPYFFTENFDIPANDTTKDWTKVRLDVLHDVLRDYEVIR